MFPPEVAAKILQCPVQLPPGVTRDTDSFREFYTCIPPTASEPRAAPVPGSKQKGFSSVYRSKSVTSKNLITSYHPDVATNYDTFMRTARCFPDLDFLGKREYEPASKSWSGYRWTTYGQAKNTALDLAAGVAAAVEKKTGKSTALQYVLAMYMPNCPEWLLADIAAQSQSLPSVCLYDTLGPDTSEYILNFCESPVIVASLENIPKLLDLKPKLPHLGVIISSQDFDYPTDRPGQHLGASLRARAVDLGLDLYSFSEILELGKKNPTTDIPPRPDDIYAINFTSGTTGRPKGAILSHSNIVAATAGMRALVDASKIHIGSHCFSFLPLAHIYERVICCAYISMACKFSYPHAGVAELMGDIFVAKPEVINMVPRVLNRIAGSLKAGTIEAEGFMGAISRKAFAAKLNHLHATGSVNHAFWDRVWSNKIKKKLGLENMQFIISGSAPLAGETIQFLRCALGFEILQGYGLTESMGGCCVSMPGETDAGHVGAPNVAAEFKLRDVPELNYLSADKPYPRGELLMRGPQLFKGYYKNPEKTDEAYDKDGWFFTGDVALIDDQGRVTIIDRVKNFFKLAQGEYVAAEKIENIYTSNTALLNQIFVHGNSHETFLVGLCAVNPDAFAPWVSHLTGQHFVPSDTDGLNTIARDPKVRRAFLESLNGTLAPGVLAGFEKVKNLILGVEPMTIENGCLTPTLKIVRSESVKVFKEDIDAMYKEGPIDKPEGKL